MLSVTQLHWLASSLTLVILKPKAKTLVFAVSGGCPADYPAVKASPLPSRDGGEAGTRPLKAKPERTETLGARFLRLKGIVSPKPSAKPSNVRIYAPVLQQPCDECLWRDATGGC